MNILEENIFVVGPVATGESFFGRTEQIRDLETVIFAGKGSRHIVGPTRIGKTSLVEQVFERNVDYPRRFCVQINMAECEDAFDFWFTLSYAIKEQIQAKDQWNPTFNRHYETINKLFEASSPNWWNSYKGILKSILSEIKAIGYQLVLSLDEFDAVERLFGQKSNYFQLLRTVYSDPKCATSGVIISRRRLQLFEAKCPYISTYHGVFPEMTVLPFNQDEIEAFYEALGIYDVKLSSGGKKRLERYTGNMPYLCCMFGEQMVLRRNTVESYGDKEIDSVFTKLCPQIDRHYRDLIDRLDEDGHLDYVYYLSIGAKVPKLTDRELENLTVMGVLIPEEKNSETRYYAFSKDFMTFFRLEPLKLPAWDIMTSSEKKIKAIFKKEFPKLAETTYQDITGPCANNAMNSIDSAYPELALNWKQIKGYSEELCSRKEHPTVLDVLTLSKIIGVMLDTWNTRFHIYFDGDESWKMKLEAIKKVRNPMAHAQVEHVTTEELAACMKYCEEIIRMKY